MERSIPPSVPDRHLDHEEENEIASPTLPDIRIDPRRIALFLDFDGTLADIVDDPANVDLPVGTRGALIKLFDRTQGALAIVTGRAIEDVDGFLHPLILPIAGVHGLARRTHDGRILPPRYDRDLLARAQTSLTKLAARHPDTMLEVKPGSLAFHYRRRPDLEGTIAREIHEALGDLEGLKLLNGKMVLEVKAGNADKGSAIDAFMEETPFVGRFPVFAGDDVTDEDAMRRVNARGGVSIKIGPGKTCAAYRSATIADFRTWLAELAARD